MVAPYGIANGFLGTRFISLWDAEVGSKQPLLQPQTQIAARGRGSSPCSRNAATVG